MEQITHSFLVLVFSQNLLTITKIQNKTRLFFLNILDSCRSYSEGNSPMSIWQRSPFQPVLQVHCPEPSRPWSHLPCGPQRQAEREERERSHDSTYGGVIPDMQSSCSNSLVPFLLFETLRLRQKLISWGLIISIKDEQLGHVTVCIGCLVNPCDMMQIQTNDMITATCRLCVFCFDALKMQEKNTLKMWLHVK